MTFQPVRPRPASRSPAGVNSMNLDSESLQALRECCRDDAAFERMQHILANASDVPSPPEREQTSLKRALQASEAKYRELVENANSIILRLDTEGRITFFNEFAQSFFGYREDEILGCPALGTIVPPTSETGDNLAETVAHLIANPQQYRFHENENIRRNGDRVWVAWTNKAILDNSGHVREILCIGNDITQLHRTTVALQESHEALERRVQERTSELSCANAQLRQEVAERQRAELELERERNFATGILDTAAALIVVLDRHGRIIRFNQACEQITGYWFEEVRDRPLWEFLLLREDIPAIRAILDQLSSGAFGPCCPLLSTRIGDRTDLQTTLETRSPHYYENDWVAKDGTRRSIAWSNSVLRNSEGEVDYIISVGIDVSDRRAAERELKTAKDRLQVLLDTVPGCIAWIRSDLTYLSVNRYLAQMTGHPPEAFLGRSIDFGVGGREFRQCAHRFFTGSDRKTSNEIALWRNGEWRHYLSVAQKYADGESAVFFNLDITELKRAEEAVRYSEEKFAKAFRASPDSMTISTFEDGRFLEVNDAFLRATGYRRDEIVGYTVGQLQLWRHPEDRDRLIRQLRERGSVYNQEAEFRTHSGEIRVGLFSAETIDIGDEPCLLAAINDISDRKHAETQLREAAQRERLLGEISTRIRQSLDLDEILNTAVEEVRHVLGADRVLISYMDPEIGGKVVAESVGEPWASCLSLVIDDPEYLQEIIDLFEQTDVQAFDDIEALDRSPPREETLRQYRVRAAIAVAIVPEEQLSGLLIVHQCERPRQWREWEIELVRALATQIAIAIKQGRLYRQLAELNANLERQVEERTAQLQQKMRELEELNRLKDVFLHAVSHDLRTPTMGMSMVLNNFLQKTQAGDRAVSVPVNILQNMTQSSERQLNLINSLLQVHSNEMQGVEVSTKPFQISQLVREITLELDPLIADNRATLVNRIGDDLPLVRADANQLWRVFENLMTNALKYNRPGLTLTLDAIPEGEWMRCEIGDDGVGMSAEQCDRLFELYYRGGNSRHSTGVGLGLYLCKQIIAAHGGDIGVTSEPGAGSTFWFSLPLAKQPATIAE